MEITSILSICALVISFITLYISYKTNKYNLEITNKTNNCLSMIDIEKSLKDIPNALRFHGVEVNELKRNKIGNYSALTKIRPKYSIFSVNTKN